MYDVVTIGDAFQDLFVTSSDFKIINDRIFKSGKSLSFEYGAKIDISGLEYYTGGSAINTAICFAKAGLSTSIRAFIGADSSGEKIQSQLNDCGIDTSDLKTKDDPTSTSIILSSHGDRTILSYHGNNIYDELSIAKSLKTKWFYVAPLGKKSDLLENKIIENIAKNGSGLIWNPGPTQIKKGAKAYRHLVRLTNIIFLNREEALNFSEAGNCRIEEAMKTLHNLGAKVVVITDGKNGAKCFDGSLFYHIDASPDERVDATGAGDAFASAFSAKIIDVCESGKAQGFVPEKEIILEAMKWGIIVSGSVVGQVGANAGMLLKSEILQKSEKLVKLEAEVYS